MGFRLIYNSLFSDRVGIIENEIHFSSNKIQEKEHSFFVREKR